MDMPDFGTLIGTGEQVEVVSLDWDCAEVTRVDVVKLHKGGYLVIRVRSGIIHGETRFIRGELIKVDTFAEVGELLNGSGPACEEALATAATKTH